MLLTFWTSRIATIRSAANHQTKLGLVLEEKVAAPLVPKLGWIGIFRLTAENELNGGMGAGEMVS